MENVPDWVKVVGSIVTALVVLLGVVKSCLSIAKLYLKPILDGVDGLAKAVAANTESIDSHQEGTHEAAMRTNSQLAEVRNEHRVILDKLGAVADRVSEIKGALK